MKTMYINIYYYFKAIDPVKKYTCFTFTKLNSFDDILLCHCEKEEIVKVDDTYFIFDKMLKVEQSYPKTSSIVFKKGRKIIYTKEV